MSTKEITVVGIEETTIENGTERKSIVNPKATEVEIQAQRDVSNPEFGLQKKTRPRACRPINPVFDAKKYVEIIVTFNALKNFDLKEVPKPGQYVIRASCMGTTYGHFISKSVDIHSIALHSRGHGDPNRPHCPDINIDEELFFYIRYKELIDNPILLSLLDTSDSPTTEYDQLSPIGYMCLDIASILNSSGSSPVKIHVEPWVIIDPKVRNTFLGGPTMLQLQIECQAGMPTPTQLKQGNMMTVFIESMVHPPEEVIQNISDPKDSPEMQVLITLPHSEKEPFLEFSGGKINDGTIIEPHPLTTLPTLDEATQTADFPNSKGSGSEPIRHWASVLKNWSDLPKQAAAISTTIQPEKSLEVFGDAAEAYSAISSCQDPLISWDAQHKKYIPMESYKKMLTRLSQDVIWPLEIVVTTQKPGTKKEKKTESSQSEKMNKKKKKKTKVNDDSITDQDVSEISISYDAVEPEDESDILFMNELGKPTTSETAVVYHGIAFVDLSRLVYPGEKSVRFACRVYPFSKELLMSKTCLTKSAFEDTLSLNGSSQNLKDKSVLTPESEESNEEGQGLGSEEEADFPFIVLEINLNRAIIPLYKTPSDVKETVQDYIPPREIPRRKLVNAGMAQQRFRRAVLEAAAEVSAEYSNHYWKDVINGNKNKVSADELKKGFVFYLNASGRYLILREHLRQAVSQIVQQKCLNLRPSGFQTHRDFQSYLHDMYTYLVDEIHETLSRTALQEVDPLDPTPEPPKAACSPAELGQPGDQFRVLEQKTILRELLFYAEESLAQGDFDNCHRLHLQRICQSKEAPQCWVDFSIMWLSRGDDRMAEIAVREALRSDPKNIHALIIAGIIAIRHNDERGIDCLSGALALRPQCPEILVILGVSLATVNNEMGSDYFFRKAAYLHKTLTGQPTDDLDKTFDKISKSVGIKQSVMNIAKAQIAAEKPPSPVVEENLVKETSRHDDVAQSISGKIAPSVRHSQHHRRKSSRKSSDPNPRKSSDQSQRKGSDANPRKASDPNPRRLSRDRKMSKDKTHRGSLVKNDSAKMNEAEEDHYDNIVEEEEEELYTKRNSISGQNSRKGTAYQPRFNFESDVSNIVVGDAILPPLRPSLIIPWNVTEFTDKMKAFLEAADKIPPSTDPASDEVIKAEYDKIGQEEEVQRVESHQNVVVVEGNKRQSISKPDAPKENEQVRNSSKTSNTLDEIAVGSKLSQTKDDDNAENKKPIQQNKKSGPTLPVYMNRLGSELVWTAQLLLQMRMFDMMDGVLARELYVSGLRSIQFLYLRAMSLYLRQGQQEAIPILEEAIALDSENSVFWIIKGHCYYELGQNAEAVTCYETALKLPVGKENRHLLYLRYGSLTMDGSNSETAKKVFLHGIQKYPTPYMWLATGNTCFIMGDYDEAEASFTEANRLDNTNPITWAHLALINLAKDQPALAEQSYKWALRFGLKKGKIMDEIKRLQEEKGFGDPSFPRVPNCIPHDYYVKRLGRQRPFDIYRDALINDPPGQGKSRFQDTDRETELKRRLKENAECGQAKPELAEGETEATNDTKPEDSVPAVEGDLQEPVEPTDNEVNADPSIEAPVVLENNSNTKPQSGKSNSSAKPSKQPVTSTTKKGKKSLDRADSRRRNKKSASDNLAAKGDLSKVRKPGASAASVEKQPSGHNSGGSGRKKKSSKK